MSLITPAEAQAMGAGLALSTAELQALIDREEAELVRRFGANYAAAPITETATGGGCSLYLKRQIAAVTSIAELLYIGDTATTTLTTADYYIWGEQGRIERIAARWGAVATVVYTPVNDTELRKMVLIELIRIAESQSAGGGSVAGLSFSISGGGDTTGAGWAAQREAQYRRLGWLSR